MRIVAALLFWIVSACANDARGKLTSDGSRSFGYDLENRLTTVLGSATLTLEYDPLGRLARTQAGRRAGKDMSV